MLVMSMFLSPKGRVRILWRMLGFFGITLFIATATAAALNSTGVIGGSLGLLAGSVVAGWVLLSLDGRKPAALGFYLTKDSLPESFHGLVFGSLISMMVVGTMAMFGGITWVTEDGTVTAWIVGAGSALAWFAIPAAAEEALLRGYPLQALTEAYGPEVSVVTTAVAFGALHLWNPGVGVLEIVNVTVAGLLFGIVYVKTLSLWCVTAMHLGWNWVLGYAADVSVSGLDLIDAPLYEGSTSGGEWLGGGTFGPEGSVVATAVLLGATVWTLRSVRLVPNAAALRAGSLVASLSETDKSGD